MKYKALKLFGEDILNEARLFSNLCLEGKRWGGNPILIVLDACLDSSGLNYFTVVVPKVRYFREKYIISRKIKSCTEFEKIKKEELLKIFKNERVWNAMKSICSFLSENDKSLEFKKLKKWAENANPKEIKNDPIGKIKGVGLNTFQYLRIQCGIDTIMPDKIIIKWIKKHFKDIGSHYDAIEEGKRIAKSLDINCIELCWAIWIKESKELNRIKIE